MSNASQSCWWRHARVSVRGFIVAVLAVGVWMGWFVRSVRIQRQAVEAIRRAGGHVYYDWKRHDGEPIPKGRLLWPQWLVRNLGVDFFANVDSVFLRSDFTMGDRDDVEPALAQVGHLRRLKFLALTSVHLSEAGIKNVATLSRLQTLYLSGTDVGDAELARLKGLSELRRLALERTNISDAGLEHLEDMPRLVSLGLGATRITDAGLSHLHRLTKLERLTLVGDAITDAGLEHLKGLTALTDMSLDHTGTTMSGAEKLRQALPRARIISAGNR